MGVVLECQHVLTLLSGCSLAHPKRSLAVPELSFSPHGKCQEEIWPILRSILKSSLEAHLEDDQPLLQEYTE